MIMTEITVPIGLYRHQIAMSSPVPYVFTNPKPETILFEADQVFVLAHHEAVTVDTSTDHKV
jgi:hypothetical protein